jgi:hypothetical protein
VAVNREGPVRRPLRTLAVLVLAGAVLGSLTGVFWSRRDQKPDDFSGLWTADRQYGLPLVYGVQAQDVTVGSHFDIVDSYAYFLLDAAICGAAAAGIVMLLWTGVARLRGHLACSE